MRPRVIALCLALLAATSTAHAAAVRFGIQTSQQGVTYEEVRDIWKAAEELGFHSAWNFDHFMPILGEDTDGPCLEGWTMLAALAAETSKIRIGTLVTGNTYRNPALLAKMATTVDLISNGRTYLGIGAAWFGEEHEAYGFPFYTDRERAARLDEALQVITKLWTEDHPTFAALSPIAPPSMRVNAPAPSLRKRCEPRPPLFNEPATKRSGSPSLSWSAQLAPRPAIESANVMRVNVPATFR